MSGGRTGTNCICGHEAGYHTRRDSGVERCGGTRTLGTQELACRCAGYVNYAFAPTCLCGHIAVQHNPGTLDCALKDRGGCGCDHYRAILPVPAEQFTALLSKVETIVVVVPVPTEDFDWPSYVGEVAEGLAGDVSNNAKAIFIQSGPAMYYVAKHAEPHLIGGTWVTEGSVKENLLRLYEHHRRVEELQTE